MHGRDHARVVTITRCWSSTTRRSVGRPPPGRPPGLRQPDLVARHQYSPQHAPDDGLPHPGHVPGRDRPSRAPHLPDPCLLHPRRRHAGRADPGCPAWGRRAHHHPGRVQPHRGRLAVPRLLCPAAAARRTAAALPGRHGARQDGHHRRPVVHHRYCEHRSAQPARQLRDQHGGLQRRRGPADGGDLRGRLLQHPGADAAGVAAAALHGQVLRDRADAIPTPL